MYRNALVLILCLFSASLWSQFDPFKYVVVPVHFEAFKQANMHKTSTLVKFYLEQRGYPAVYDLSKPRELEEAPCMGVYTQFIDDSNLIATRVILRFVDCEGKIVFETIQGKTKEKEYKLAYKEVIQQVFTSFDGMSYSYKPPKKAATTAAVAVGAQAAQQEIESPAVQEAASEVEDTGALASAEPSESLPAGETLYAQPIEGGYQLVDSSPKIRMLLMESNRGQGVYMAVVEGNSAGTVYREGDTWIHEYFEGGKVVRTPLNIKF